MMMQEKVDKANKYINQLEELEERFKCLYNTYPDRHDTFDLKANAEALHFAIDFIKWGMK